MGSVASADSGSSSAGPDYDSDPSDSVAGSGSSSADSVAGRSESSSWVDLVAPDSDVSDADDSSRISQHSGSSLLHTHKHHPFHSVGILLVILSLIHHSLQKMLPYSTNRAVSQSAKQAILSITPHSNTHL